MQLADFPNLVYATSTRADGNMSLLHGEMNEVVTNRRRFLARHNIALENCVVMSVQHKDNVITAEKRDAGHATTKRDQTLLADALVTKERGLVLFLLTADCLPIALYDPVQQVIALVHAGWRPTSLALAKKAVGYLVEKTGSNASDIIVSIGPGIHKESYLKEEVLQQYEPRWQPYLEKQPDGRTSIDLVRCNRDQLVEAGIAPEHVTVDPTDTATSETYFSHYQEQRTGEQTGRFATILAML